MAKSPTDRLAEADNGGGNSGSTASLVIRAYLKTFSTTLEITRPVTVDMTVSDGFVFISIRYSLSSLSSMKSRPNSSKAKGLSFGLSLSATLLTA